MARAKQPVMVEDIEFDALISEERTLEATIPEYAVEDGFTVSDAILLNAEKLSMTLFVTETPVTWLDRHGAGQDHVEEVCKRLEDMYYKHDVVTVVTSNATYTDMGIESITISRSTEIGYAREIPIQFKKVRKTKSETTTIPDSYGKSGTTGAGAGNANTSSTSGGSGNKSFANGTNNNTLLTEITGLGYLDTTPDIDGYEEYLKQYEQYSSTSTNPTAGDFTFAMDHVLDLPQQLVNTMKDSDIGEFMSGILPF